MLRNWYRQLLGLAGTSDGLGSGSQRRRNVSKQLMGDLLI